MWPAHPRVWIRDVLRGGVRTGVPGSLRGSHTPAAAGEAPPPEWVWPWHSHHGCVALSPRAASRRWFANVIYWGATLGGEYARHT